MLGDLTVLWLYVAVICCFLHLQGRNVSRKCSGILILISGLILIWIRMSPRSLPEMLWFVALSAPAVSPSVVTVWKMARNVVYHVNGEKRKVIQNTHDADPDQRHKLTTSRESSLAHSCHVWWRSTCVSAFVSYPAHSMTDKQTDRQTDRQTERTITIFPSLAMFVCLSVSKITQKRVHGFWQNVACRQMSGHGRTD